jgi:hypothetical protein
VFRRIQRVLVLDPQVFEDVEHDHTAGPQALAVVLAASLAGGFGSLAAHALLGRGSRGGLEWTAMLVLAAFFFVAWIAWSYVTLAVGTLLFGGVADAGELQRTLGFAAAPGLLMVLPGLGVIVGLPWSLVAMVIAVRQALDFTTARALGTVAVGALVLALVVVPAACVLGSRL